MKEIKEVVFVCKSVSEEYHNEKDPYIIELENRGFSPKIISVLDFTYKNIDSLKSKLCQPDLYSGIIFTSPRCVRAVMNAVGSADNLNERWRNMNNFAVGETTARLATVNLNLNPEGSCAGNGVKLAPIILSKNLSKPLLLPCGNLKMDSLENLLVEGGVTTECVEVYETIPHPNLESALNTALLEQKPSYIVFFSPSGIHYTYHLFRQNGVNMDNIKWVSIGPTTAAALQSYNLSVYCSAEKPTPQCLADTIAMT